MTADTDLTKLVGGDLGLACVLVTIVVAVMFWLKRDELSVAPKQSSPAL